MVLWGSFVFGFFRASVFSHRNLGVFGLVI
uniref:Uncharacterized protein n=1 Tax=Arundo donax TaxID=35708 RepID=A0A0A9A1G8_ARUDO